MSLTFVPTPLGNLRDITLRALDVLRECDLLVAEDTRVARRLLSALDLPGKPLWSYREQNAAAATENIIERARIDRVALVCDAGMPGISDPGRALIAAARAAGVGVEVLPGPSAFVCAVVLSGFEGSRFTFMGFFPRAAGERERAIRAALASETTSVWYESPNRLIATLEALATIDADLNVFVGRELTKRFEQQIAGRPADVLATLERPVRGEIVVVIAARAARAPRSDVFDLETAIAARLESGAPIAAIARELAREGYSDRATIYRLASARKQNLMGRAREPDGGE